MIKKFYRLFLYIFITIAVQNLFAVNFGENAHSINNLVITQYSSQDSSYASNNSILKQNYPNPFNPSTTITFNLPERSYVELNIYNVLGVKLKTLIKGVKSAGTYSVQFNASRYPSGIYIYELQADNFNQTKKMIYMK